MAKITVRIDLHSLAHFLNRELPDAASPTYAEVNGGNVIIHYAMCDEAQVDFDELRVYLDFSDWEAKTVEMGTERLTSGTFDAHSVYLETAADLDGRVVFLTIDGAHVKEDKALWYNMEKELREAFKEAKAIVVTIPGIGMRRIE